MKKTQDTNMTQQKVRVRTRKSLVKVIRGRHPWQALSGSTAPGFGHSRGVNKPIYNFGKN